jgi:hypothetical protein
MKDVGVSGLRVVGVAATRRRRSVSAQAWDDGVGLWYTCAIRMGLQFSNASMVRSDAVRAASGVRA